MRNVLIGLKQAILFVITLVVIIEFCSITQAGHICARRRKAYNSHLRVKTRAPFDWSTLETTEGNWRVTPYWDGANPSMSRILCALTPKPAVIDAKYCPLIRKSQQNKEIVTEQSRPVVEDKVKLIEPSTSKTQQETSSSPTNC